MSAIGAKTGDQVPESVKKGWPDRQSYAWRANEADWLRMLLVFIIVMA